MNTNFNYPTAGELFAPTTPSISNGSSGKAGLLIGLILLTGTFATIAICQYNMRQQLSKNLMAEIERNKQKMERERGRLGVESSGN